MDPTIVSLLAGGFGGLLQDISQNKKAINLPRRIGDELYLGTIAGVLIGAGCGFLVMSSAAGTAQDVAIVAFMAGLGLKGFGEALTSKKPR